MAITQTGVTSVGSSVEQSLRTVVVQFPQTFASVPVVVATAFQQEADTFPDTFGVTLLKISASGFTANVYRVDNIAAGNAGWSLNAQLGWIATG